MAGRFILRLDDASPTMDRRRWSKLEVLLDRLKIRPLVAVVAENLDQDLQIDAPDPAFWDQVRKWKDKGWTIGMHGYQHRLHFINRKQLILPFYDCSEFAGLSLEAQSKKICAAWEIFQREDVEPTVWIAPAHCFDRATLHALKAETSIRIISDGIACDQFLEDGFYWLPQQLWSFSRKSSGLWTICLHPNTMSDSDIDDLSTLLSSNTVLPSIVSIHDLVFHPRRRDIKDKVYALWFWRRDRFYKFAKAMRNLWSFYSRGDSKE